MSDCPRCQIVRGVKFSGVKLSANMDRVKLSAVLNCPRPEGRRGSLDVAFYEFFLLFVFFVFLSSLKLWQKVRRKLPFIKRLGHEMML